MLTPSQQLSIGRICQELAANDIAKRQAFTGGVLNRELPMQLMVVRKSIEWIYSNNQNDPSLTQTLNYLIFLCGPYLIQATGILGIAGGVIVNPSTGVVSIVFVASQSIVGQAGSLIAPGGTTATINVVGVLIPGSVVVTLDGTTLYLGLTDRISYTYTYVGGVLTITFNQPAITGQVYSISYQTHS